MIVFNESVVNKCDALPLIVVGVCVHIGFVTVGSPSCVTQPDVMLVPRFTLKLHALDTVSAESVTRGELSTHEFSTLWVYSHYATGVVAS